jgi:hypothetical protein
LRNGCFARAAVRGWLNCFWHAAGKALRRMAIPAPAATAGHGRIGAAPPVAEGQYEPMPGTMSFADFLSGLNPLQHLPVVGTIYRAITGDVPPAAMRVAGAFLLGGPVGAIATAVGTAAEEIFARTRAAPAPDTPPTDMADAGEQLSRLRAAEQAYGDGIRPVARRMAEFGALPAARRHEDGL